MEYLVNNKFHFEDKINFMNVDTYADMSEDEMLERLSLARKHSEQGKQREATAVISDMRSRYGLYKNRIYSADDGIEAEM